MGCVRKRGTLGYNDERSGFELGVVNESDLVIFLSGSAMLGGR